MDSEKIYELKEGKGYIKDISDNTHLPYEGDYLYGLISGRGKQYNIMGNVILRKGRLYINNRLEYEGEFLFDKKWNGKGFDENGRILYELKNGNGKVKEYIVSGELVFEGEYLNGKKHGKGKEYDRSGKLVFEGEYLNGKKNGKGKEYDFFGKLKFEGEYLNGKLIEK